MCVCKTLINIISKNCTVARERERENGEQTKTSTVHMIIIRADLQFSQADRLEQSSVVSADELSYRLHGGRGEEEAARGQQR